MPFADEPFAAGVMVVAHQAAWADEGRRLVA